MEIETDKTSMPVPAPGSGIIEEIFVKDGDTVKPGMNLFKINITGEAPAPKPSAAKEAAPPPPPPPTPAGKLGNLVLHRIIRTIHFHYLLMN